MERRRFLQTGVAGLAMTALTFKPSIASAQTQQKKLGIVQGATGETATQISVLVPLQSRHKFKVVSAEGETKSPALIERFTFPKHDDAIINISFDELCPDVDYIFIVSDDLGNTLDQRMFSTLSIKSELSFTVSSCMDH
ncbi:MAG: hypothetical protein K2Q26_03460, partial [Bdellovibrionales bacterium]|nr:hypothetical protein [Bdellovibrionales bacterium]